MRYLKEAFLEPYRFYFLLGAFFLMWGALVWLPQIWNPGSNYPVNLHRYLMLNGFVASFIGGFLMTAVPKFSQTAPPHPFEVIIFFLFTGVGVFISFLGNEKGIFLISALQGMSLLFFIFRRILKRKANPPYSFIFIFVGLFLWIISGLAGFLFDTENFKNIQYEGAIAAIILGVGSRLIPGILGHVEVVMAQRDRYEKPISILKTVPLEFFFLIGSFVGSYFSQSEMLGSSIRALVVLIIAFKYWLLWKKPKIKTALTWSIWSSAWLIVLSFLIKPFIEEGSIHIGHSFFINGIVLLSLLIGVRVVQSHGPDNKSFEESPIIYVITFLIVLAALTRVSAHLLPDSYLTHLGYSAILLVAGVLVWLIKYGRLCFIYKMKLLICFLLLIPTLAQSSQVNFKEIFKDRDACFVVIELESGKKITEHNSKRCDERYSPYSSFKIPASLMAFDKGVFKDEHQVIKWDGVKRDREEINQDLTPLTFMSHSAKWVTQWIMPQIGMKSTQDYLEKFNYGNKDFSGGMETAWVSSSLKISVNEQIKFLTNFWKGKLGTSTRANDLTKKVMFIQKIGTSGELFGKTGTGCLEDKNCKMTAGKMIGWFVGILKTPSKTYVFAGNASDLKNQSSPGGPRMRDTTIQILTQMGLAE